MRPVIRSIVAVVLIGVVGCAKPERDVALYRQIVDEDVRFAKVPTDGVLTLTDALALANRLNESIGIEGEQYVRSIVARRRAVAGFLPTVSFAPRWSVAQTSGSDYDANLDAPLSLDWTLFDGGQTSNRYWREVYLVERQRDRLLEAQEGLLFDVASVYYTVLRAEAQIRVLESSLVVQDERLRDTRGRADAGVARPLDVSQTEAQTAQTRVRLIDAKRQLGESRALLAFLVNAPVEKLQLRDDLDVPAPSEADRWIELAETHRSELAAAGRAIAAAQRGVDVAVGQYYPSVRLNFDVFLYRESAPDARTWAGVLQANLPIFSAGRIEADVREAWSFLREAILVDSQTRRRVRVDIEQNLRDIAASEERVRQLDIALMAARDAFQQADAAYVAGLGTNLERVSAQDALLQAELASATEKFDQQVLRLRLLRTAGTLRETLLTLPKP